MVECPFCHAEIDYVRNFDPCWAVWIITVEDGKLDYSCTEHRDLESALDQEYLCPACGEDFVDHELVERLLLGKPLTEDDKDLLGIEE